MTFLLDTNTVIYLINDRLAMALPPGRYGVSVITEIELLSFPDLQVDEEEQRIRAFLAVADRVAISEPIRDQAIVLRRLHRLKIPDAIIAATAMVGNAVLFSNDGKLATIPNLQIRAVPLKG
ncbi:MAG: type II toxin-antitoxin system VapC family toxin [Gammaproteobacteria bacterium]